MSYDYLVMAGTQGMRGHRKSDRLIELADRMRLPCVFFTEGGGGRPGDTDLPLVLIARAPRLLVARETSGTRLYGSHDGGITWKAFGQGLPSESFVTGGVCVAETLLLSTLPEGLWRCDVPAVSAQPAPLELLPQPPTSRGDVSFALRAAAHVVLSVHDVAASSGTTAISVRVSMSPSARWKVTRSVANSARYQSAGAQTGWCAADQARPVARSFT